MCGVVMVMVEVPAPGIDGGPKVTFTPAGWPVADKAIGELKPPETVVVIFEVPLPPRATLTDAGDAEMVKLAATAGVMVKETAAVCASVPPVPMTVML